MHITETVLRDAQQSLIATEIPPLARLRRALRSFDRRSVRRELFDSLYGPI